MRKENSVRKHSRPTTPPSEIAGFARRCFQESPPPPAAPHGFGEEFRAASASFATILPSNLSVSGIGSPAWLDWRRRAAGPADGIRKAVLGWVCEPGMAARLPAAIGAKFS